MTIKYVKYCTFKKLSCTNAAAQDVVLCLQDSSLIVQPDPACGLDISTIEAQICQAFTTSDSCQNQLWHYMFSYDDTQLVDPTTPLVTADIVGVFCHDCLTAWVTEQISCAVGNPGISVSDTSSIDLTLASAVLSGVVKVSADANNAVSIHSDGLYATNVYSVLPVTTKSANYTALHTDCLILCDATTASFTVTLPAAASNTGKVFIIKKTDAVAHTVTIDGNASETIDGTLTKVISAQWGSYTIQCNGSNWFVTALI